MRGIQPTSKFLAIYLLTNENFRMTGIYRLPKHTIIKELGIENHQLEAGLDELRRVEFCEYDEEEDVVWVIEMALTQIAENPNEKQRKGIENELRSLNDSELPFVDEFIDRYGDLFKLDCDYIR